MCGVLYDVDVSEEVARVIFSPSMVAGDRVSSTAFQLVTLPSGAPESYLSVWRTRHRIPTRENTRGLHARTAGDEIFGYATLTVGTIHSQDVSSCTARVKRKSRDENAYHVGIYYTLDSQQIKGEYIPSQLLLLLKKLANHAITHPFPPLGDV